MVMKKRYVNALLLGMSLCVAAPGTAVSASEIPAQESAVEDTSDAELEAIMREAEAAAAGADGKTDRSGRNPGTEGIRRRQCHVQRGCFHLKELL